MWSQIATSSRCLPPSRTGNGGPAHDRRRRCQTPARLQIQGTAIQPQTLTFPAEGPQTATLLPAKPTKKRLRKKGKASAAVSFTYVPKFGSGTTQTVTVPLRQKLKKKR